MDGLVSNAIAIIIGGLLTNSIFFYFLKNRKLKVIACLILISVLLLVSFLIKVTGLYSTFFAGLLIGAVYSIIHEKN